MLVESTSNMDMVNFIIFGSGVYQMDFLTMRCHYNNYPISPLHYCYTFRTWLERNAEKHHIVFDDIKNAYLTANINVATNRDTISTTRAQTRGKQANTTATVR